MESSYASGGESESGSDSSGPGIHLPAEGSKLRDAFFVSLQSTTVLAALVATEQHHGGQCRVLIDRPFCPDGRSNLETMLGAMFCLLRRGNWGADELTPELLVTALWVVQSWEDSQWQWASWTANAYAKRDPIAKGDPAPLQEAMLVLQMEVRRLGDAPRVRLQPQGPEVGSGTGWLLAADPLRSRPAGPHSLRLELPPDGLRAARRHPGAERVPRV